MNRNSAKMVSVVQPVAQCLTSAQRFDPTVETLITSEVAETLIATDHKGPGHNRDHNFIAKAVAFPWQSALDPIGQPSDVSGTLIKNQTMAVQTAMQVRRLTPVECERLQGFPDGYTNIPWRKKPESPDGPRYKALGNSMAVPCMKWIGERINQVMEVPR